MQESATHELEDVVPIERGKSNAQRTMQRIRSRSDREAERDAKKDAKKVDDARKAEEAASAEIALHAEEAKRAAENAALAAIRAVGKAAEKDAAEKEKAQHDKDRQLSSGSALVVVTDTAPAINITTEDAAVAQKKVSSSVGVPRSSRRRGRGHPRG